MDPFKELGVMPPERVTLCSMVVGKSYMVLCPSMGLLREMVLDSLYLTIGDAVFVAPETQFQNRITFVFDYLRDQTVSVYELN
jgi:hypothetical protein